MQDRFHDLMGNVVEEFREIEQQDIALIAVFPVVLVEVLRDPAHGKIVSLVLHAGTVVIDKGTLKDRHKGVVAQAALDDPLTYDRAADMTMLPALIQVKLVKAGAFEFPGCELVVCVQDVQRRVGRVFLDAGLPRHTATAALVRLIEVLIAEHLVVVIVLGAGGVPLCSPCGSAALIPCFSTFFACHKKPRLPRMPVGRLQ